MFIIRQTGYRASLLFRIQSTRQQLSTWTYFPAISSRYALPTPRIFAFSSKYPGFSASHQSIPLSRGMFYSRMFGDRLCCTTSPSATPRSLPLHVFVPALVLTSPQLGGITDHLAIIYVAPQRGVLHLSLLLGLAFFGLPQVNS